MVAGNTPVLVHNNNGGDECDPLVDLYHGTTKAAAANIRANGIDTSIASRPLDFRPGFYTTRDLGQATQWASRFGKNGTVLHFQVRQSVLDSLNSMTFTDESSLLTDTVRYYRGGGTETPFDMVEGPMLMNSPSKFLRGAPPTWGGNQVVFFGDTGPILDAGLQ